MRLNNEHCNRQQNTFSTHQSVLEELSSMYRMPISFSYGKTRQNQARKGKKTTFQHHHCDSNCVISYSGLAPPRVYNARRHKFPKHCLNGPQRERDSSAIYHRAASARGCYHNAASEDGCRNLVPFSDAQG